MSSLAAGLGQRVSLRAYVARRRRGTIEEAPPAPAPVLPAAPPAAADAVVTPPAAAAPLIVTVAPTAPGSPGGAQVQAKAPALPDAAFATVSPSPVGAAAAAEARWVGSPPCGVAATAALWGVPLGAKASRAVAAKAHCPGRGVAEAALLRRKYAVMKDDARWSAHES